MSAKRFLRARLFGSHRVRRMWPVRKPAALRRQLEALENRTVPTTLHWTGAASSNWGTAGNWLENAAPANGDTLIFDTTTVGFAATAAAFNPNNNLASLTGL